MVAQPLTYYRFDKKNWINPDTSKYEEYMDYVNRYDITDRVISFKIVGDVDYQPDSVIVILSKQFFTNPLNLEEYQGGAVDPDNAFNANTAHVIAIGPQYTEETGTMVENNLFFGFLQNYKDLGSDKVQLEFWSFIKVLIDSQCGSNYHLTTASESYINIDVPNSPTDFYMNRSFSEIKSGSIASDPGFPAKDINYAGKLPYAIYSFSGDITEDVTEDITININYDIADGLETKTATYTISKEQRAGLSAEYISEQFFALFCESDYLVTQTSSEGVCLVNDVEDTNIRVSFKNGCIIFEQLTQNNILLDLTNKTPFTISSTDSGISIKYYYADVEHGRAPIIPNYERRDLASYLPLFPLSVYGIKTNGTKEIRHFYEGYALQKIVWRLLNHVGWCREPFFDDINPYSLDYITGTETDIENDGSLVGVSYASYISDGLDMDFVDSYIADSETQHKTTFYSSFVSERQSNAYNIKNIADAMSSYLYSSAEPNVTDHIPAWDDSVYNRPNTNTISFYGCTKTDYGTSIDIHIWKPDGSEEVLSVDSISNLCTKSVASIVYDTIMSLSDILEGYYKIKCYGSTIYIEYGNDVEGIFITQDDITDDSGSQNTASLQVVQNITSALTDEVEIEKERIYYLRKWGVCVGFNPYVSLKANPAQRLQEITPSLYLQYGGADRRGDLDVVSALVSRPVWATDTKDLINRITVKYARSSDNTDYATVVFPSETITPKYYVIRTNGYAVAQTGSVILSMALDTGTGSITKSFVKGDTSDDIAAKFDGNILIVKSTTLDNEFQYYFKINSALSSIFAVPIRYEGGTEISTIEDVMSSTSQINLIFNDPGTNTTLKVINKEMVGSEPEVFNDARDSQAKYGPKEISISLPETASINDTIDYAASLLTKYMNPKERVVCEMTEYDNWTIPMFTYVNIKDYTNYDIEGLDADWEMDVTFYGTNESDQNLTAVIFLESGTVVPLTFAVLEGDTYEDVASKFITALSTYASSDGEPFFRANTSSEVVGAYITVQIFTSTEDGRTPYDMKMFGSVDDYLYGVDVSYDSTYKSSKIKNKNMLLMHIENDSKKSTYTAIFGQPTEEITNIVNQINTWVSDVEKNTSSANANMATFDNVTIGDWLYVMGTNGMVTINNGGVNADEEISSLKGIYGGQYIKTDGVMTAKGNIGFRVSGTPPPQPTVFTPQLDSLLSKDMFSLCNVGGTSYVLGSEIGIPVHMYTGTEWIELNEFQTSVQTIDTYPIDSHIFFIYTPKGDVRKNVYLSEYNVITNTFTHINYGGNSIITSGENITNARLAVSRKSMSLDVAEEYEVSIAYVTTNSANTAFSLTVHECVLDDSLVITQLNGATQQMITPIFISRPCMEYPITFDIEHCHDTTIESETGKGAYFHTSAATTIVETHYVMVALTYGDSSTGTVKINGFKKLFDITKYLSFVADAEDNILIPSVDTLSTGIPHYISSARRRITNTYGYTDSMYVWGVFMNAISGGWGQIYISSKSCTSYGIWSKLNLTSKMAEIHVGVTSYQADFSIVKDVGYLMVSSSVSEEPKTVELNIYKLNTLDLGAINSNYISNYFTKTNNTASKFFIFPKVAGLDNSTAMGIYDIMAPYSDSGGSGISGTEHEVVSIMDDTLVSINSSSEVVLQTNDHARDYIGDYFADGARHSIVNTGYYNISWQLHRMLTALPAYAHLMHKVGAQDAVAISSDYGVGILKGNHSSIKLSEGDIIYLRVSRTMSPICSDWFMLEGAYIELYMNSGVSQ